MLSPKWRDFMNDAGLSKSGLAAYNSSKVKKIAILMTDGEFNTAYSGVGTVGMSSEGEDVSPKYALSLCDAMKANDTEVFTIGFMLNKASAKATMAGCATPDTGGVKHFYDAANGNELKEAFNAITANIERVQLTN